MAMAAGVCKGMYDVHALPALADPHTCGHLTASWLKGVRRQPDSCMLDNDEPGTVIEWTLSLARVREAFEAACAAAAATIAPVQGVKTAAAALAGGRRSSGTSSAASGASWHQGWGSSGAAAVKSAAAAAVSLGTSMFRGRKRSLQDREQQPVVSDTAASPLAGRASQSDADMLGGCNRARKQQRRLASAGMHGAAHLPVTAECDADDAAAAGHTSGGGLVFTRQAAAGAASEERPSMNDRSIKAHSQEVTLAGYTWRLVLYFVAKPKQDGADEGSKAAAVNAAVMSRLNKRQQIEAGAAAPSAAARTPHSKQQQQRPVGAKARKRVLHAASAAAGCAADVDNDAAGFAPWVQQDLGSLQTPWGSKRGRRTAAVAALHGTGAAGWLPATIPEGGQLAVAAAAAVRLPGELSPAVAAADDDDDEADLTDSGAQDGYSWEWQARLAIEAWPCIALQPGVSVAAFSASLAAQKSGTEGVGARQVSASIAAATGNSSRYQSGRPTSGQQQGRQSCRRRLTTNGGGGALSSRPLAAQVDVAAAGTAVRAPRSSSTHITARNADANVAGMTALQALTRRTSGGPSKRAAAVAANHRIQLQRQACQGLAGSDSPQHDEVIVEDSSDADDDPEVVDTDAAGTRAGAAGGGQTPGACGATTSSDNGSTSYGSDDGDDMEEPTTAEKENRGIDADGATYGAVKRRKKSATAADQDADEQHAVGSWVVRTMPQGRHVKSSKCDTGYSNFFNITLQQGRWDEGAWRQYVQPEGLLKIRGTVWNVR